MIWPLLSAISISLILFYKLFPFIFSLALSGHFLFSAVSSRAFEISAHISMFWALLNTSLLILISSFLAWSLRKERKLLYFLIFIPWAIPVYLTTMIWRFAIYGLNGSSIISSLGLPSDIVSSPFAAFFWASVLSIWLDLPMVTLSILGAIDDIPSETIEAARLDGASEMEVFFDVTLPSIRSVLESWFLLYMVRYAHSFTIPFLLVDGGVTKLNWVTPFGAIGNVTTLGVLNYRIFKEYDINQILGFSSATYIFLGAMIAIWIFRNREIFQKVSLSIFSLLWFAISGDYFSIIAAVISLLPRKCIAVLSLFFLLISGFKSLPFYILLVIWAFSGEWRPARFGKASKLLKPIGALLISLLALGSVITLLSVLLVAFTDYPDTLNVTNMNFGSLRDVLVDGYGKNMLNSLILSVPVLILSPIFALPLAYSISRKGLDWMLQMFLVLRTVAGIHILSMIFVIYAKMNLINSLLPISAVVISNVVPQVVVFMKGYFDSTPRELEEAALLEGGKSAARKIVFTMATPQISVGALMGFMAGWNAFLAPLMFLFDDSLYPTSVKLYSYVGDLMNLYPHWNLFGAGAILNLAVALLVFVSIKLLTGVLK